MNRSIIVCSLFVLSASVSLHQTAALQQKNPAKSGASVAQNFYGFTSAKDIVSRLLYITEKLDELDSKLNKCIGTSSCETGTEMILKNIEWLDKHHNSLR